MRAVGQPRRLFALSRVVHHRAQSSVSQAHGGDDNYRARKLICDFSTITNSLGPVPAAIDATRRLFEDVEISWTTPRGGNVKAILEDESQRVARAPLFEHYPQRHDDELAQATVEFLGLASGERARRLAAERLLFGNGASELIDLLARAAPEGPYCVGPEVLTQYMEYERVCTAATRAKVASPRDAAILCLVNPTNPTGDFREREEMEAYIAENATPGSWVVVDESMLFWAGPDWNQRGISDAFVDRMHERDIHVFRLQSWTSIFACAGVRIGSVVCPSSSSKTSLAALQVPWSLTNIGRTYLRACLADRDYLERTWATTSRWRHFIATRLQHVYPSWKILSEDWLPFLWINTGDAEMAKQVYETALDCGCPVRHAEAGYNQPTFLRVAVRRPSDFAPLHQALLRLRMQGEAKAAFGTYADVEPSVIDGVQLVHIDDLRPHEYILGDRAAKLKGYIEDLPIKHLPALIVCSQTHTVIDGHHRLQLFKDLGMSVVPAIMVNYEHDDILVVPPSISTTVDKADVIRSALQGTLMEPKSTQHVVRTRGGQLMPIIVLAPQIAELAA